MDRQSRIIVGGLVSLLLLAFVLIGPGRAWAESIMDGDNPALEADYTADGGNDGTMPPPFREPQSIRLDRPQLGSTSPDPLDDDGVASPQAGAVPASGSSPQRQEQPGAAQRNQRARDLSGLEDGDLSTTGDLAF